MDCRSFPSESFLWCCCIQRAFFGLGKGDPLFRGQISPHPASRAHLKIDLRSCLVFCGPFWSIPGQLFSRPRKQAPSVIGRAWGPGLTGHSRCWASSLQAGCTSTWRTAGACGQLNPPHLGRKGNREGGPTSEPVLSLPPAFGGKLKNPLRVVLVATHADIMNVPRPAGGEFGYDKDTTLLKEIRNR